MFWFEHKILSQQIGLTIRSARTLRAKALAPITFSVGAPLQLKHLMAVILVVGSATTPMFAFGGESVYGWWITQGATITVNGEAFGMVELYGIVGKGDRVCAVEYTHFLGQVVTMLYKGTYSDGRAKISFLRSIKGEYFPEYGPVGTLDFFLGRTVLVRHMYFRGDVSPRTSIFDRFTRSVPKKYADELARECATVL